MRRIALAFVLLAALALPARADTQVELHRTIEVDRATVRLADVFEGVPGEIDCDIATAPAPGKSIAYDVNVLVKLAQKYGLGWQPQSLSDRTVVTRAATRITQEMIRAAVLEKLQAKNLHGKLDVFFDRKALEVALPSGLEPVFSLNNFDYDSNGKRFRTELVAETGAAPVSLPVTGRVTVERDVPVLARRLVAGTVIGKDDLDFVPVLEERLQPDMVTAAEQLIGQAVRRDTAEGNPLREREIMPPRLVTRGGLVTLKIETSNLLITAQGKALQDGAKGEVVRVTNVQSNRVVEGVVDGSGVVRILSAQKIASAE